MLILLTHVQNTNTCHQFITHNSITNVITVVQMVDITYIQTSVTIGDIQTVVIQVLRIKFMVFVTTVQLIIFICGQENTVVQ